eukprot:4035745-Prorocentrum_lima.AAC.1
MAATRYSKRSMVRRHTGITNMTATPAPLHIKRSMVRTCHTDIPPPRATATTSMTCAAGEVGSDPSAQAMLLTA